MKETYQSFSPLLPDVWENCSKTFVRTHSGRCKPRGKEKRKRLQSRAMECGAYVLSWVLLVAAGHTEPQLGTQLPSWASWVSINACVQVKGGSAPTFVLGITTARLVHNHHINKHKLNQYPHNRIALEPDVVYTVNELRRAGVKKNILKYIHENSACNPTNQDVHNLVRTLRKRENTSTTSAKRLKKWMIEFSEEPGNVGLIFVDSVHDKTVATCIRLQTKHMRELFNMFPDVLMIDATHGTIASKYKVFSIMAHDVFGKGVKKNNPAWTRIKCILIDKYFTETSVLKVALPDAMVLLSQFHVIKYLQEKISSAEYGFISWQKQHLHGVVSLLVYAWTEHEFEKYSKYMRHIMSIGRGAVSRSSGFESNIRQLGADSDELGTD
ncbi:hypothetical protein L917_16109 [Phytophthora nicotianae]|uniref:ZSWIM1/3 RNaseH-like domain-containing protein n=1 Tax=Phytophthora nicotianae TaxID=4792 RepID=W2KI36_PHYNI|nr:hypothetical protein L917_16109 [Phytophthora nicotianae]